jgi:plastocyanin
MRRRVLIVAALGLGVVSLAGCGSSGSSESSGGENGGQTTVAGVTANNHGTKSVSGEAEVELDDDYFNPTVLEGKAGDKVTLELKNEGQVEHNVSIDAQGIDKDLEAGEDAKVTVTIPQSGAISFYCKYHKSAGMAGALAVKGGSGGMTGTGGGQNGTTTDDNGGY